MPFLPIDAPGRTQRQPWPPGGLWASSPSQIPPALDEDRDCLSTDDEDFDPHFRPENPLKYFLTPATPGDDDDDMEFEFDFDAGIEDSNSPRQIVRSISPSTLDGLRRYKTKSKNADCAILDDDDEDDDEEEYIRFPTEKVLPFGLEDYFDHPRHGSSPSHGISSGAALLSPTTSFHVGSPSGRPSKPFTPPPSRRRHSSSITIARGRPASRATLQRRHSWREPSPDVWSIDEEPEKETMSEMGMSAEDLLRLGGKGGEEKSKPIDIPAAKPLKRVRFVLPDSRVDDE